MSADPTKVLAARPTVDHDGEDTIRTERKGRVQWVAHTTRDCAEADLWASPRLPDHGDPLKRYVFVTASYEATGTWQPNPATIDATVAVVRRTACKSTDTETLWLVDVFYEGITLDPVLAFTPKVRHSGVTYQETSHQDPAGQIPVNSAGDAYEDGITRDADRERVTVTTRHLMEDVDPTVLGRYKHTRNSEAWQLPTPKGPMTRPRLDANGEPVLDGDGNPVLDPVTVPAGCAKISQVDYEYVELTAHQNPAQTRYAVDVTVTVDYDLRKFRNNAGQMEYVAWRDVRADQGYHELRPLTVAGAATPVTARLPIWVGGRQATSPQLLNGQGVALKPAEWPPNLPTIAEPTGDGRPAVNHDFYATEKGKPLTITAPGVLGNDFGADSAALVNTARKVKDGPPDGTGGGGGVTLAADGSFGYTPPTDFVGYVWFTYKATNVSGESAVATVLIYVGDTPRVRVFDRYPLADWSAVASFLNDW